MLQRDALAVPADLLCPPFRGAPCKALACLFTDNLRSAKRPATRDSARVAKLAAAVLKSCTLRTGQVTDA